MAENELTDEIAVTDGTADVQETDIQERKNKSKKLTVLITYIITVLCLLAGLLVPLFNWGYGSLTDRMLLKWLPSMVNDVLMPFAKKQVVPALPWFLNTEVSVFNLASLAGVLYALLTVVSLFMIIPVCLGKKEKKTSVKCALAIEICALLISALFIAYSTYRSVRYGSGGFTSNLDIQYKWNSYNMYFPLGAALTTAIIQSVLYKGSIGVSKTFGIVLSVLALITMLDVTAFIPALFTPLYNLTSKTSGLYAAFVGGIELESGMGIDGIALLYSIKNAAGTMFGNGAAVGTVYVLVIALAVLTVFNGVCDAIGIATGRKFKKNGDPCRNFGANLFDLIRFAVTFTFALILVLITVFMKEFVPGLFLCAFTVVALFQLLNALIRLLVANSRFKKAAAETDALETTLDTPAVADPEFVPQPADEPVYAQPVYEQPAYEQPANSQPAYEQPSYDQPVYDQPADSQPIYEQQSFEQPSYEQPVYEDPVYDEPANDQPLYGQSPYEQPSFDRSAYNRSAYERPSYDRSSLYRQPDYEQPTFDDLTEDEPEINEAETKPEPAPAPAPAAAEQPAPAPAPAPAPVPDTIYVYGGDTDEFMDTLTDKEKVEFVEVFLKKSKGAVNGVPEYCIKGDNSDFFPAVFVHINRYRDKLSDTLMSKMYKQLGKTM